jgi:hypothetical protein
MNYRSVLTDEDLSSLRERNQARLEAAQKALGTNWVGYTHLTALTRWRIEASQPETFESIQESAIAEHQSMQIRWER